VKLLIVVRLNAFDFKKKFDLARFNYVFVVVVFLLLT